jgi:hypothetical protein
MISLSLKRLRLTVPDHFHNHPPRRLTLPLKAVGTEMFDIVKFNAF